MVKDNEEEEEISLLEKITKLSTMADKNGNTQEGYWDLAEEIRADLGVDAVMFELKEEMDKRLEDIQDVIRAHRHGVNGEVLIGL